MLVDLAAYAFFGALVILGLTIIGCHAFERLVAIDPPAPYPFCRTPHECSGKGYCPKDPACNE